MKQHIVIGSGLLLLLSLPLVRHLLKSSMVGQMLIQIPLLVIAGYWIGAGCRDKLVRFSDLYNRTGITGLLLIFFTSLYWLLPRSIDAAQNVPLFEVLKFITIPLLIGVPLALSWDKISVTLKGFVWANVISMSFVMGWLYRSSPVRLCNNYLQDQQILLGTCLMALAILLLVYFFCKVFFIGIER